MQKNLIALLRASMPTMREANGRRRNGGVRDLARELQVIRPYLEILKVRMEERLATRDRRARRPAVGRVSADDGADPGRERHQAWPGTQGRRRQLTVKAEIVHGKLQVSVADTGLGFGRAATAGTGVGLANIRERLQLLYGAEGRTDGGREPRRWHHRHHHRALPQPGCRRRLSRYIRRR
jgi:hypothetical protein